MTGAARAAVALAVAALAACRSAPDSEQPANVYVPPTQAEAGAPTEAGPSGPQQVDRAGRPLVAVLFVAGSLQDDYNATSTFDASPARTLDDSLLSRIERFDTIALDGGSPDPVDWPADGGAQALAAMLSSDALLVDTALPCASDGGFLASYLDVEREAYLGGPAHKTCGGRTPGDAVVDTMLTLVVTAGRAPVSQGISGPARSVATTFPYLADPN